MNEIEIALKNKRLKRDWLKKRAERVLDILGIDNSILSILITDDVHIRELNREYRNKDRPTDVLSFPDGTSIAGKVLLGDVVISVDTAQRQAQNLGHSLEEEVERLLVHGIIHLLGYDHEPGGEEERKFQELEEKVNAELRKS